ncbi:MAG TPA: cytochrome c peroxidase [Planctomycetota bacterium]|nr:cytochrome c peroxidase [Planctomycetota bacterium]
MFFDPALSGNGALSCATCHSPSHGFSDPRPQSHGMGTHTRHAPTLLLSAYHHWFGWGGRADSLWSQALGPLENPIEMGGNRVAIVRHVLTDADLGSRYRAVFGEAPDSGSWPLSGLPEHGELEGLDPGWVAAWEAMPAGDRAAVDRAFANVGKALEAYERQLVPGPSGFDRYVADRVAGRDGNPGDFPEAAKRGFDLFRGKAGCVVCHSGPTFSDGEFHNTGAPEASGGEPTDPGRFQGGRLAQASRFQAGGAFSDDPQGQRAERTRLLKLGSEQWGEFKTPTLRNLLGRAPYMHQGQFETLERVIEFYDTRQGAVGASHHQEQILRPLSLTPEQRADLLAFLRSLEGTPVPQMWAQPPLR